VRKYLLSIWLIFISLISYSQGVEKYRTDGICVVHKDNEGDFLYQDEWKPCTNLIVVDTKKNKANIYGKPQDVEFDIIRGGNPQVDKENNVYMKFECIDKDGIKCGLTILTLDKGIDGHKYFIKIEYNNTIILYRFIKNSN
jgi:hypothetical protein